MNNGEKGVCGTIFIELDTEISMLTNLIGYETCFNTWKKLYCLFATVPLKLSTIYYSTISLM